jgi:hypothetical protein
MPWRARRVEFVGSRVRLIKVKRDSVAFVLDETALDRAAKRPPSATRGSARFVERTEGPEELVAFLKTFHRTNTWRPDGITAVAT